MGTSPSGSGLLWPRARGRARTFVRRYLVLWAFVGLMAGGFVFSVSPTLASASPSPASASTSPAWTLRPGCATDVAVGAGGSVWVVGCNPVHGGFGIYRWNGSGWVGEPGGAFNVGVDSSGNAWVTNDVGQIYRWNGSGWTLLPGCAVDIDVGGSAWVTGCNEVNGGFSIYRWNGSGWVGEPGGAIAVGVDSTGNHPWVTNKLGNIYSS